MVVCRYEGDHIAPTELEIILNGHDKVQESLVVGIDEPTVKELVSAIVVLKEGCQVEKIIGFFFVIKYFK